MGDLGDLLTGKGLAADQKRTLTPAERRRRRRRRRRRAADKRNKGNPFYELIRDNTRKKSNQKMGGNRKRRQKKFNGKAADRRNKGNPFYENIRDNTRGKHKQKMGTVDIHRKGNKHGHGGKGRGGHGGGRGRGGRGGRGGRYSRDGMIYYGLGEFPGVSRKKARTEVGRDINQMLRELAGEARGVKKGAQFDVNKALALYARTKGDLDYVYGEADDFAQGQNSKIADLYANNKNGLQGLYQALQSQQGQTTDANRAAAMQEQARLGIQQAGMGQYDQDANFMQQMAQSNQANAVANNDTAARSSAQIGELLRAMGQGSLTSAVGRSMNTRNDSIQDIRQEARQQLHDIAGDVRNIRRDRPNMINDLYNQMEQNAYQRWAESQQADFNNQLAANQFNLDVSKLNSDNLWQKAKLRQEARRQQSIRRQQNRQYNQMNRTGRKVDNDLADLFSIG